MPGGLYPPTQVIASWPSPNYTNPDRHPHDIIIVSFILGILASIVLVIRLAVRLGCTRNFGADDALAIAAYITAVGLAVGCSLGQRYYGLDLHVWDNPVENRQKIRKITLVAEVLFVTSTSLVKLSILVFFRRLTQGMLQKRHRILLWTSLFLLSAQFLGPFIAIFVQCAPMETYWLEAVPGWSAANPDAYCFDEGLFLMLINSLSVFTDFLVALLPSVLFWRLDVDYRAKLAYILVFICGMVLCIIGIARVCIIYDLYYETYDDWNANPLLALTVAEPLVGFIICSIPSLKVFFAKVLPDYWWFWTRDYTYATDPASIEMEEHGRSGSQTLVEELQTKQLGRKSSVESTTLGRVSETAGASVVRDVEANDGRALTTWFEFDDDDAETYHAIGVAR